MPRKRNAFMTTGHTLAHSEAESRKKGRTKGTRKSDAMIMISSCRKEMDFIWAAFEAAAFDTHTL